jgi:hypothetical protein
LPWANLYAFLPIKGQKGGHIRNQLDAKIGRDKHGSVGKGMWAYGNK